MMIGPEAKMEPAAGYEIYIMRHGIAGNRDTAGPVDDAKRRLTPEGREKMQKAAKGLKRLGLKLDWILSSPLLRAVETAEIVAESLPLKISIEVCEELRPGRSFDDLMVCLAAQPERKRILLVGHEPDPSLLAARLIGAGRNANFGFKKGGCCLIVADRLPP